MPNNWQDNISFILVEPTEQGNIGAAARAIKNMGFCRFGLINPPELSKEAFYFAHRAEDVLAEASVFKSLQEALKDEHLVVGTSRRRGRKRGLFLNPWDGSEKIFSAAQSAKVAVLFGRESRGLYNEEVSSCSFMMQIPTGTRQPSLNLAQSVILIAYEILRASILKGSTMINKRESDEYPAASAKDIRELLRRVQNALLLIGYVDKDNNELKEKIMQNFSRITARACLAGWEINMLHGICAQIEKRFFSSDIMIQK